MSASGTAVRKPNPLARALPAHPPRRRLPIWIAGTGAALVVSFGLFLAFGIDLVVRRGIERVVRDALGAPIEIRKVRLRLKGKAEIEGARIGNPGGFPGAVALDLAALDAFLDGDSLSGSELFPEGLRPSFGAELRKPSAAIRPAAARRP